MFNKRECLRNAPKEAMQEGTDNGHALLGEEVIGKEITKLKRHGHPNLEGGVEGRGSTAKKGEHGGVSNAGLRAVAEIPSQGF